MFRNSNNSTAAGVSTPHKHDRRALFLSRINDERMAHAMSILVDREVTVNLESGGKIKGIFNSFDPSSRGSNKAIDIALGSRANDARDKHARGKPMIIHGSDYHFISAYGITKNTAESKAETVQSPVKNHSHNKFKTDTEISSSKAVKPNPTLTEWKPTEPINDENLVELDKIEETEWDQFETNSKGYGVVTTYDENLYTTTLDINEIPESVREQATTLAAEIMANNGEHSYAQVESLLEDEDCATNEHVSDNASQRHVKKKEKVHQTQKIKARTTHDTSSTTEKPAKPQPNRTEEPEQQVKHVPAPQKVKHTEKQLSHQISINALNLEPASAKVDGFSKPLIHHERKSSKNALDDRNTEKNEFTLTPKVTDEEISQVNVQLSSNQGSKDQSPSDANKKLFKFNPNASSFTPNVNNEHTTPVSSKVSREASDTRAEAQPSSATKTHEFKPFKSMQHYPRLSIREHRRIDPRHLCTQGTEDKWGVSTDISYRDVFGDLSSLHLHPNVAPLRAHHIMAQNPMAAAFMLPHGTPISYPAYIGGIPIGVVPYGPKITPRFINGVPYGPQIIQNPVLARRTPTSSSNLHALVPINAVTNDHIMFKARSVGHHPIDDPNHPKIFDHHQLKHIPMKKS